jgi:two-component system, OmpR family, KDP operon response regulator KdpE
VSENAESLPRLTVGDLSLDVARHQVTRAGNVIGLTELECRILYALMRDAGHVCPATELAEWAWGYATTDSNNALKVAISRLRRKLEPHRARPRYLVTVTGIGYMFLTADRVTPGTTEEP